MTWVLKIISPAVPERPNKANKTPRNTVVPSRNVTGLLHGFFVFGIRTDDIIRVIIIPNPEVM